MADNQRADREDVDEEELAKQRLDSLHKYIKATRILLISQLSLMALVFTVLLTSVVVVNVQLSGRSEVPAEDFDEQLTELEQHLEHLIELHNSEAKVYFDFQDSLAEVAQSYDYEKLNELRRQLTDRERDQRKLLQLMRENASSLAEMIPGSRDWTGTYAAKIQAAISLSEQREKAIKRAMAALEQGVQPVQKDDAKTAGKTKPQ